MKKRPLQDIVTKPQRPRSSGSTRPGVEEPAPEAHPERPPSEHVPPRGAPKRRPPATWQRPQQTGAHWFWLAVGAAVVVLIGAGGLSLMFSGVSVTVFPKQEKSVVVDGRFFARAEQLPGELQYTTMTLERTASTEVEASERSEVEEFATGEIIIYNNYDGNAQRLIKNTRFEAPDGKIYRIRDSIVVPGQHTSDTGEVVPGQVTATVYADQPGEEYNLRDAEFTIPGFEGSARYEAFSAETKTPIDGGFVGTRLTIAEAQEAEARERLEAQLRDELRTAAFSESEQPEDKYLFEDALFFEFSEQPSAEVNEQTLAVRQRGVLTAILFDKAAFAQHIAANTIAGYDGNPVRLVSTEDLDIAVSPLSQDDAPSEQPMYELGVSGTAHLVWQYDAEQLRRDLTGREEAAINTILSGYPGIERIKVNWRPFWKFWQRTFPEQPENIEIITSLD